MNRQTQEKNKKKWHAILKRNVYDQQTYWKFLSLTNDQRNAN